MKTSQLSKDTSADRRSKLGVCTPPYHSTTRPSTPLSLSALWGLWTGRIKSDWEQFGLIPLPTQMLFLKCFKEKKKKPHRHYWIWLSLSVDFFFLLFLGSSVQGKKKKTRSCVKEKRGKHYRKLIHKTTLLFWQNISSQRARRSAWRSL